MEVLPAFAAFLLSEHLDPYVAAMIGQSKKEELPLLKKLDKFSEEQLMELGRQSHAEILAALAAETVHLQIANNVERWIANQLEVIERDEVVAEDVTLSAYIKRKTMQSFIPLYTREPEIQQKLREEIDAYTTQEELISYNVYLKLQQEQLNEANEALLFQENLLLEAQEISELGSYFIDYENPENSLTTPQIHKILGQDRDDEALFFSNVHPEDAPEFKRVWDEALENGDIFEYSFRYVKDGVTKKLHSRGVVTRNNGMLKHIQGTLRDITENDLLIRKLTEK